MRINRESICAATERLYGWCSERKWMGVDPYDFIAVFSRFSTRLSHPLFNSLDGSWGLNLTRLNGIKRALGVTCKLNPKAVAVAARACFRIAKASPSGKWIDRGTELVNKLVQLKSTSSAHMAWGLPFVWTTASAQRLEPGHPTSLVTALAGLACLDAFDSTRDYEFLEVADEAAQHLVNEIGYSISEQKGICFWYGYRVTLCLHNSNLIVAEFLNRAGKALANDRYLELAERATEFSLHEQNSDGSWYYFAEPTKLNRTIDNYHTGFVISALLELRRNGMEGLESALVRGLCFYSELFNADGSSRFQPSRRFPIDIHDLSQGIIAFAESADFWKPGRLVARRILGYTCDRFLDSDGAFNYRIYRSGTSRSKYLRWSQAWMLLALATVLRYRVLRD